MTAKEFLKNKCATAAGAPSDCSISMIQIGKYAIPEIVLTEFMEEYASSKVLDDQEFMESKIRNQAAIISLQKELITAQDKYIGLLGDELDDTATMLSVHGWKSQRVQDGIDARLVINELREQVKNWKGENK